MHLPINPRLPFRFSFPCYRQPDLWSNARELSWPEVGLNLPDKFILPQTSSLENKMFPLELRLAWDETGLGVAFRVWGKKRRVDCRVPMTDSGDNIRLWIDTRDMRQVHRAVRSCHQFALFPTGGGRKLNEPVVEPIPIHLAKETPLNMDSSRLFVRSELASDGYLVECVFPAEALTDFRPDDYPKLGICWSVLDGEFGEMSSCAPFPIPYASDPSFWSTVNLVE